MYVMAHIGKVNPSSRGNAAKVSRALSAAVNRYFLNL
jgi:hypothetical protein